MTLDLIIIVIVAFSAIQGAILGAARQVAGWCALAAAYFCARPIGSALGPKVAESFHLPLLLGTLGGIVAVFIFVLVAVRFGLTQVLRSVLVGKNARRIEFDRGLGFLLGGLRAAAVAYVVLSALTFAEDHLSLAGKKLGLSPKRSFTFALAQKYNLFELTLFSPVHDLVRVAQAANQPETAKHLKADPAYRALQEDPHFREVMTQPSIKRELASGDTSALLKHDAVLKLIDDHERARELREAAESASTPP